MSCDYVGPKGMACLAGNYCTAHVNLEWKSHAQACFLMDAADMQVLVMVLSL